MAIVFDDDIETPQSGKVVFDEEEPSFLEKTASNIIPDLKQTATGIGSMIKEGAYEMPKRALETGLEVASGTPYSETPSGMADTEFVENAPEQAAEMVKPITHPIDYMQEHPVQQTLNILGVKAGLKGLGRKPTAIPETPVTPPPTAGPKVVPMRERPSPKFTGASRVPPPPGGEVPPTTPPPARAPVIDKMKEAGEYARKGYEGFAKKPGMTENIADWIQGKSQKMAAQDMGMTPLQARKMGPTPQAAEEAVRAIGQYGIDSGIVSPTGTLKADLSRHAQLLNNAGKKIGSIREMADKMRNPVDDSVDVLQVVREALGEQYAPGMPGATEFETALRIVAKSDPSYSGVSKMATELNRLANANNQVHQPHRPFTDVANVASEINNQRIKRVVGPEYALAYEQALREFGVLKKIGEFLKRKVGGEVKRLGPGSLASNMVQKGMDEFGYKAGSHIANKMSTRILKDPSVAKSLPSLFKEFINQVEDLGDEIVGGMAHGGVVSREIGEFVRAR